MSSNVLTRRICGLIFGMFLFLKVISTPALAESAGSDDRLSRTFGQNDVYLEIAIEPPQVDLKRDTMVSITISHPDEIAANLPADMSGRFQGFNIAGYYSEPSHDKQKAVVYNFRLIPEPGADVYRIRPFAVQTIDSSVHPPERSWFNTEMIYIPVKTHAGTVPASVETSVEPVYIRPSFRKLPYMAVLLLVLAAVLFLTYKVIAKIRFVRKIRRMSPRERAFFELSALLAKKLPEKGLFKDFYVELTMVVRRYIERRYAIRAPRQTTEEFLASATGSSAFNQKSITNLRQFLSAADLVKFAGVTATLETAESAVAKARDYLERESIQSSDDNMTTGTKSDSPVLRKINE